MRILVKAVIIFIIIMVIFFASGILKSMGIRLFWSAVVPAVAGITAIKAVATYKPQKNIGKNQNSIHEKSSSS
jgi:hypothetical protein